MIQRGTLFTLAALALSFSGAAAAAPQAADACFGNYAVTKVVPHRTPVATGQGTYDQLVGARAFVPAQPGLTGEWLHAQLERRSAAPQPGTECPLDVPGVNIRVQSAGPGFWVSLASQDRDDAKEVLRRARTLTR